MPDFADLHRQRQQHSHVTQQLLWEEYRQANPDGYQYSRFRELYQRWRRKQDVVLRHGFPPELHRNPHRVTIAGTFGSEMQREIALRTLTNLLLIWQREVESHHKKNRLTITSNDRLGC